MKSAKILKSKFHLLRPENGQLVVTAEIHRVTNSTWGIGKGEQYADCIEVQTLEPSGGKHIMRFGKMGQQCVMVLKPSKRAAKKKA